MSALIGCVAHRTTSSPRLPGRGANLLTDGGGHRYVYAALSRRAGGASLGIDLTPAQNCSLACVYCQVPRDRPSRGRPKVDTGVLRSELTNLLRSPPVSGWADLCVAGSGEPTLATNFGQALDEILDVSREASFDCPLRLYTNGLHLEKRDVRRALAKWADRSGEIWVKLDALNQETCAKIWRRRIVLAEHVARIWDLARELPVGIQTMMMSGDGMPRPETLARQMAAVISWGLATGAKFQGIHLVAATRPSGDPEALRAVHLRPATLCELQTAAGVLEAKLNLPVQVFA